MDVARREASTVPRLRHLPRSREPLSKGLSIMLAGLLFMFGSLQEEFGSAAAARTSLEAAVVASSDDAGAFSGLDQLSAQGGEVLKSVPDFPKNLALVVARLSDEARGANFGSFLLTVVLSAILAIGAEASLRSIIAQWPQRGEAKSAESRPIAGRLAAWTLLEVVAILPLWLILYLLSSRAMGFGPTQQKAAHIFFTNVLVWRVVMLVPRIWFRPGIPSLRITRIDDRDASTLYYVFCAVTLGYALARSVIGTLKAADASMNTVAVQSFLNDLVMGAIALAAIWTMRRAAARWLASLVGSSAGTLAMLKLQLARNWWAIGVFVILMMSIAFVYGMLSGNADAGVAIVASLGLVLALIFLESLFDFLNRAPAAGEKNVEAEGSRILVSALVVRCIRFLSWLLIVVAITEIWLFDVAPSLFSGAQHAWMRGVIRDISLTVAISYLIWQIACFLVARQLATAIPPDASGGEKRGKPVATASRLHTLLPLARGTLGVTISVLAGLTILSRLGVNTTHLIAGASVLGLAVSFGSQTLVRDIVSGVFYLADDAFRIGEYVDAGRVKGTVEGFTLRSVKLRHQNGQVHIVPFGQLGSITNFSRDWITLKFNLRVARDVDLERVRKITKAIGLEMMDDPEMAQLIIEPLKLQGIADILDNALLLRFKVTTKPGNPTLVQRQAIRRIISRFPEAGIHFPSAASAA